MKQTGTLYSIANNENSVEIKQPIPDVFIYFSQNNVRKLTTKTDAQGKFNFDLPIGSYQVAVSQGATSQVYQLAGGAPFELTSASKENAFEQWVLAPVYLKPEENPLVILMNELVKDARDSATKAKAEADRAELAVRIRETIDKPDPYSPAFEKISADTIKVKPGIIAYTRAGIFDLSGKTVKLVSKMPGNDYIIVVDKNGELSTLIDKFEEPANISAGSMIVGGYHYSLIPENETVASGEFATSGDGMIWTQADVDRIRGVNEFSIWDIRFRAGGIIASPLSPRFGQLSNHGMAFDRATNRWYAMFHVSSDVDKFGVSRAGTDIASGTVLPVIPSIFNGDGKKKYDNLSWWTANELVHSQGARLLYEFEFNSRAFGTTENKVAGGSSSTYPKTERIKGLTSKIGCEQVTGVHWYWGLDSSYRHDGSDWSYKDVTGGRGQVYTYGAYGLVRVLFSSYRTIAPANVGSRCVSWYNNPWNSLWNIGAVATRDLLIL